MSVLEDLQLARHAYESRAWTVTSERLAALDRQQPLSVEDLVRWGIASHLRGDVEGCGRVLRRGHEESARDDPCAAALCAFWLGLCAMETGQGAVAGGWFAQAAADLEAVPQDCPERGYLMLPRAMMAIDAGDLAAAEEALEQVRACGERHQVPDLVVSGTAFLGRIRLDRDDVAGGLALMDRAMTGLLSSAMTPILAGQVYCGVVEACQWIGDHDRVRQWTAELVRWCEAQPDLVPYTGQCAVHRGQLMMLDGALAEACVEFRLASERYALLGAPFAAGLARYEEGEVHRLRGDLDDARRCYDEAAETGHDGQPGRALLGLVAGDGAAVLRGLERALAEAHGASQRLRVLPAIARAATETGDLDRAERAVDDLSGLAASTGVPSVRARAAAAAGALALARGGPADALPLLREAHRLWVRVRAPYEVARVRADMGRACAALGDPDGARVEWRVARRAFAELGTGPDERRVGALLDPAPGPDGLTPREVEVLGLVAAGLTNPQVAARLYLSEKTVSRHLGNIFTKLGVRSRTAAAAYALRHDLA